MKYKNNGNFRPCAAARGEFFDFLGFWKILPVYHGGGDLGGGWEGGGSPRPASGQ